MSKINVATIKLGDDEERFLLNEKEFSTGSRDYHGQGKMRVGDKRYQINVICVEIGSKPKGGD